MKRGPRSPQLEKALAQKRRPNTAKNKEINFKKNILYIALCFSIQFSRYLKIIIKITQVTCALSNFYKIQQNKNKKIKFIWFLTFKIKHFGLYHSRILHIHFIFTKKEGISVHTILQSAFSVLIVIRIVISFYANRYTSASICTDILRTAWDSIKWKNLNLFNP